MAIEISPKHLGDYTSESVMADALAYLGEVEANPSLMPPQGVGLASVISAAYDQGTAQSAIRRWPLRAGKESE